MSKSNAAVLVRTKSREIEVPPNTERIEHWAIGGTAKKKTKRTSEPVGRTFKPGRFVIENEWDAFQVLDLRVGRDSQFPDPAPRPGNAFQPDGPPGFRGEFDTALPGVVLSARLINHTNMATVLRCHWIGVVAVEGERPLVDADELEII